ncbi:CHAT domain-containing protein [Actinomadura xylanilytica]|uniref:CHAT domain-containing protein n=1 Tax=Actinomadura xylanilytica TaxID=887459 RepID=UPI00255B26E6|nr:CHAT domain-containing protein [Actinomadura xylanilytica]MDL4777725.1 CHAT domain-containing protein [Actinomadura xylanilytica]
MADVLTLRVTEYDSPTEWCWELTGLEAEFLADHEVRLTADSAEYRAFCDLHKHLTVRASRDRRLQHEAEILHDLGRWIADSVFGSGLGDALLFYAPCTVRVLIPEEARALIAYPLEAAVFDDASLAVAGISLVLEVEAASTAPFRRPPKEPVGDRLRVLGLFTVPEGSSALNLRRERRELVQQFSSWAAEGKAIDLRILQYGVTRERLNDVIAEAEGWDVVHISGHGARGALLLERSDGTHDLVTNGDLVEMLRPAHRRLKLVTVAACHSAAHATVDHLGLLGLKPAVRAEDAEEEGDGTAESMLALNLAQHLRCAVVGMRFPVVDGFAALFSKRLYHYMISKGHALPRALGLALKDAASTTPTPECPALSRSTPTVIGSSAVDLKIAAPEGRPREFSDLKKTARLEQSERFVGRVGVLARASAALAPESGRAGVLFHGMAGAGKTSCAQELAYLHSDGFREVVWYQAPPDGSEIGGTLGDLAAAFKTQLPRLPDLDPVFRNDTELESFLPALTAFLRDERVLIMIDNVESLLTSKDNWRDSRWGRLLEAMTAHSGLSKIVLTSRRPPADLPMSVCVEAVHSLSLSESILLARELPNLRRLIDGHEGLADDADNELAARILRLSQGHPKLLELANGQASSLESLERSLGQAEESWTARGGVPEGFFTDEESAAESADYAQILDSWTESIVQRLPRHIARIFYFISCLQDRDRFLVVLEGILEQPLQSVGVPTEVLVRDSVAVLSDAALLSLDESMPGTRYRIHPQIAEASRRLAGSEMQDFVDQAAGSFWHEALFDSFNPAGEDGTAGAMMWAAESGIPYLVRAGEWQHVLPMLEMALHFDSSSAAAAARVLPLLRQAVGRIEEAAHRRRAELMLAQAEARLDPVAAEQRVRDLYEAVCREGDHRRASLAADVLIDLMNSDERRNSEALKLCDEMIQHTSAAGYGPWTRLADECTRLDLLAEIEPGAQLLDKFIELRKRADQLPLESSVSEAEVPWKVKERILKVGSSIAVRSGAWSKAHDLDTELIAAIETRGASPRELAHARLVNSERLLHLGRHAEARAAVMACQEVFDREHDARMLGQCRLMLGRIESTTTQGMSDLMWEGLRHAYRSRDADAISVAHGLIAETLSEGEARSESVAHAIAASLIDDLTGSALASKSMLRLASILAEADRPVPSNVGILIDLLGNIPGVHFQGFLDGLECEWEEIYERYSSLILRGKVESAHLFFDVHEALALWEPVIAGIYLGFNGSKAISQEVERLLEAQAEELAWAGMISILRELLGLFFAVEGVAALHPVPAAVVARAIEVRRSWDPSYIATSQYLWAARGLAPLFQAVVAGARGNEEIAVQAAENLDRFPAEPHMIMLAHGLRSILSRDFDNVPASSDGPTATLLRFVLEHAAAPTPEQLLQEYSHRS